MNYDFCGWATKNDLKCADGRIIRRGAFHSCSGKKVPLVWNHVHDNVGTVLGHALLEERPEGVYAYCSFNNTSAGKDAKETVAHGDVVSLSIWANNLEQVGSEVMHGVIREVSLVLAGANPGAFVESVMAHGMPMGEFDDEGIIYTGEGIIFPQQKITTIMHSDEDDDYEDDEDDDDEDDETIGDVYNAMTDKQKLAVAAIVSEVTDALEDSIKEDDDMKHNVFDGATEPISGGNFLSHSDMEEIFKEAKRTGSLKEAVDNFIDARADELMHAIPTDGMEVPTGTSTYGFNDPDMLFKDDYHNLNNTPEWISRNMDWVQKVMGTVHHTPFSRIKSQFADITEDEARAKGYIKGNRKKEEVFTLLKRKTDPQTVYKKQKMDRDDILDITSFDVVAWIKAEMRVMLNEEIARAILIGDGRPASSDDKIQEQHIRPIVKDDPLFNTVVKVTAEVSDTEADIAKNTINTSIRSRKNYKGSGNPTLFTTEDYVTEMLLLEDGIGHKLYKTEAELATALRVKEIVTVEPMEGYTLTVDSKTMPLIGVIVNLSDYNVGADKGGEINMFDDFDIDYNQFKYLIETRISGALTKPFSAITLVLDRKTS